ncbi:MAG: hypothetical protein IJ738_05665 [Alphaproteobacteria bacterium]|nr:hypothetical protein [Alphaproteobacteria bacterium]MBR1757032.1 hypothetical protein [Alphaproteobacteria bacterium]
MVKPEKLFAFALCGFLMSSSAHSASYGIISQDITADACDDRQQNDDTKTSENRAVDKAGLTAIKTAGFIQKIYPDLSASALDLIAYRIIDEYMLGQTHKITLEDAGRVCIKLNAAVELTTEELAHLVEEYKNNDTTDAQVTEVAEEITEQTTFKPRSLDDKKLLYIRNISFWNGEETNHYKDLLTGLFSNSKYFYVTDDEKLADFTVTPRLKRAEVDEIDRQNHKMQMQIELETISRTQEDFSPLTEQQNHFILFAADKNEQEIADNLLRKLLIQAAKEMSGKIDRFEAKRIEHAVTGK